MGIAGAASPWMGTRMMRLKQYLEETRELRPDPALKGHKKLETFYQRCDRFGAQLGVTGFCVRKWAYKQRRISDELKLRVEKITHGQVTVGDMVRG
jgi:hypothetical protein